MRRALSLLLTLALLLALAVPASAEDTLAAAVQDTASLLTASVQTPRVGSTGGEWVVLGLARSGCAVPDACFRAYYADLEAYVRERGGVLHERRYTEYSRVILALSAIGRDPRDVAGYDLTTPLGDYDNTLRQGINGPIWALIALDSRNYPMPQNKAAATQATRQAYIDRILSRRCPDGGWSMSGTVSDPDVTGMALQALAKYRDQPAVEEAVREALACMSLAQEADGGFASGGISNAESCAQMLVALCELGISLDDPRFVKNGSTILDCLLSYRTADGGFRHTRQDEASNALATEQGFYALVAAMRVRAGKSSLYRMTGAEGLPGRNGDVTPVPVTAPEVGFSDISGHPSQTAVEALASRKIVDGKGGGRFAPEAEMTRAEFAAIVVRALGLRPETNGDYTDVTAGKWYAAYVGTASRYGIVNGVGGGRFLPGGTITRQEAMAMVARAARLCGLDMAVGAADALSSYPDGGRVSGWARPAVAFCLDAGIFRPAGGIQPDTPVKRCEIAQMLYELLSQARLL